MKILNKVPGVQIKKDVSEMVRHRGLRREVSQLFTRWRNAHGQLQKRVFILRHFDSTLVDVSLQIKARGEGISCLKEISVL